MTTRAEIHKGPKNVLKGFKSSQKLVATGQKNAGGKNTWLLYRRFTQAYRGTCNLFAGLDSNKGSNYQLIKIPAFRKMKELPCFIFSYSHSFISSQRACVVTVVDFLDAIQCQSGLAEIKPFWGTVTISIILLRVHKKLSCGKWNFKNAVINGVHSHCIFMERRRFRKHKLFFSKYFEEI